MATPLNLRGPSPLAGLMSTLMPLDNLASMLFGGVGVFVVMGQVCRHDGVQVSDGIRVRESGGNEQTKAVKFAE